MKWSLLERFSLRLVTYTVRILANVDVTENGEGVRRRTVPTGYNSQREDNRQAEYTPKTSGHLLIR